VPADDQHDPGFGGPASGRLVATLRRKPRTVPSSDTGRMIGAFVMISGIAFLTVTTAAVTATLIEAARRRLPHAPEQEVPAEFMREVTPRLSAIELLRILVRHDNIAPDLAGAAAQPDRPMRVVGRRPVDRADEVAPTPDAIDERAGRRTAPVAGVRPTTGEASEYSPHDERDVRSPCGRAGVRRWRAARFRERPWLRRCQPAARDACTM
jgi:hypothetical protein